MAGRKSSRFWENMFAGAVVFACICSIVISFRTRTVISLRSKTERIHKPHVIRDVTGVDMSAENEVTVEFGKVKQWFKRPEVMKYTPKIFHPVLVYPESISNSDICKGTSADILIYVLSHWSNAEKRTELRKTWAGIKAVKDINIKSVFFLGKPVSEIDQEKINAENVQNKDIVQGDFIDSFANLTMKSLLAMQWINNNCMQAKYVIKADDDMFINIYQTIEMALSYIYMENRFIMCHVRANHTIDIIRVNSSKWYVPAHIFPGQKTYPTMCYANFAIFTTDVIPELYKASFSFPYLSVDDAYLFGMLANTIHGLEFFDISLVISMDQVEGYTDMVNNSSQQYIACAVKDVSYFQKMWEAMKKNIPSWAT